MKRFILIGLSLMLGLSFAQTGADWPDPSELSYKPVEFTPPEPTRAELSNGVVVYLLEDRTLPLVKGVAYVDAPGVLEPADKVGLASLTASLLREGGAGEYSPDELDEALETLAASVEATSNDFYASVSFDALSDNVDEVMTLWSDVLIRPSFDAGRLEVAQGRSLEQVRRTKDDPTQLAVREFFFRVAEGHPSGAYPTEESLSSITQDDVIDFYETYYAPNVSAVAVTGDFETSEMLEKLETVLGDWEAKDISYPDLPAFDPNPDPKVYYLPKEVAQSTVLVGHPSVLAYSPEYNDLDVASQILGNGFSSRLFTEIRTKRGLAYATGSQLGQGFSYPGTFFTFAITNGEDTGQVIELLLGEIRNLQEGGVTEAELEQRRETILNRSLFRFTSPAAITERTARVGLLGLEPGYYEAYLENVQAVTPEEVQAVAQQEMRPDDVIIMVVGDATLFDRPLENFGEVITLELDE